jgi:hypothetical protein
VAKRDKAFAVYTLDPGGRSGTANGVFIAQKTLVSTMRAHSVEAKEWEGDSVLQAANIARDYHDFYRRAKASRIDRVELVVEEFRLRQMAVELSPVEVTFALKAYLNVLKLPGVTVFQSASQAKSFATSPRLKRWGLYAVGRGSDHKRDATRHLALRVSTIIDED